ncbi:MAG: L-seryl-tRNA(Sec) selenium transferase [Halioglobus sp.]|nr:L-seryl-tRNA(Sec) selenium transferase [Halioglobus sp.]
MKADRQIKEAHRRIPSVDALLQQMPDALANWGRQQVTDALRAELADLRAQIARGETPQTDAEALQQRVAQRLERSNSASLVPVINLSGTVLHTNLGRASLPREALDAVVTVAAAPSNLEFDLDSGARGDRESHIEALVCELTGAEAATAVNNNAAAVLLVLNTLALGREVPVSRGELVEIGGSFRIPEVMQRAGCTLVEVGATNRTHLKDFAGVINSATALLMKVHTSNYQLEGFTSAVPEGALAQLAQQRGLPFVIDLGSGSLVDFARLGLPAEPTAAEAIANGADLVTFSGDKLLGGPQAGLIAGRKELVGQIKTNPLKRALRLDKMTLAALAEVLKLYRDPDSLVQRLPTLRQLTRPAEDIAAQAGRLLPALSRALQPTYSVEIADCASQIGSGALPVETLPSAALRITPASGDDADVRRLAQVLRSLPLPVIGRLHKTSLWLDLRCLDQEQAFLGQLDGLRL